MKDWWTSVNFNDGQANWWESAFPSEQTPTVIPSYESDLPTLADAPTTPAPIDRTATLEDFNATIPPARSAWELLNQRIPEPVTPETPENLEALARFNFAKDSGFEPSGLMDWAAGAGRQTQGTADTAVSGLYRGAADTIKSIADWNEASAQGFGMKGEGFVSGKMRSAARWLDDAGSRVSVSARYNQLIAGETTPDNALLQVLSDGARAIPDMALVIATTALTRNPNAGYAVMGAQVAAQTYGRSRYQDGKGVVSALNDAFYATVAELGPERAFRVLEPIADASMPVLKTLWQTGRAEFMAEGTTEVLTLLDEDFRQGLTPGTTPEMGLRTLKAAGTGVVAGLGMGGGGSVITGTANQLERRALNRDRSAFTGLMQAADTLNPNAQQSYQVQYDKSPSNGALPAFDAAFNQANQDMDAGVESIIQDEQIEIDRLGAELDRQFVAQPIEPIHPIVQPEEVSLPGVPSPDGSYIDAAIDPMTIQTDPESFQYKTENVGAEGTNRILTGVQEWNPAAAGVLMAWERADGQRFVVDGHQRLSLAKRLKNQNPAILARIYRESDGYSKADMRVIAAVINIAQNTGSVIDAAKIMREVSQAGEVGGITTATLERVLPQTGAINKHAPGLVKLDETAFMAVVNGITKPEYGALIGERYTDPAQQLAAIDGLAKTQPETLFQAGDILEQMDEAGFSTDQADMFGAVIAENYFKERAKIVEMVGRRAKNKRALYQGLVKNESKITGVGRNRVDTRTNQRIVTEQDNLLSQIGVLARSDQEISNALNEQAKQLGTGEVSIGAATTVVEGEIARYLERGGPAPARESGIPVSTEVDAEVTSTEPADQSGTSLEPVSNQLTTPRLFVKWGNQQFPVESVEDASRKWNEFRAESGAGVSEIGSASIVDESGNFIAKIAYNGRVFDRADKPVQTPTEDLFQTVSEVAPQEETMAQPDTEIEPASLPMDEESRLARAREQAFDKVAYHGTDSDIQQFVDAMRGSSTKSRSAQRAYWFVDRPESAAGYADYSAKDAKVQKLIDASYAAERNKQWNESHDLMAQAEKLESKLFKEPAAGQNILPLRLRGKLYEVDAEGRAWGNLKDGQISTWLDEAESGGFDGLQIDNFVDEAQYGVDTPATHYAIFNPKNIRSQFAKFDPSKSDSTDLLASQSTTPSSGLTVAQLKQAIAQVPKLDASQFEYVRTEADIPNRSGMESLRDNRNEGLFDPETGKIYLISENISSPERAAWIGWHEKWHRGGRVAYGKQFSARLDEAGNNTLVSRLANAILRDRPDDPSMTGPNARRAAVEEALAELNAAQRTGTYSAINDRYGIKVPAAQKAGWRGVVARFYEWLTRHVRRLTGSEVSNARAFEIVRGADMLARAEDVPRETRPVRASTDKSKDPFYSALNRTVQNAEGMPKKGDSQIFVQWLDGQQRKGNFKKAERDWMGVDEWLVEKGTVTRQELQDFIAANQVVVEEKVLSENPTIDEISKQNILVEDRAREIQDESDGEISFEDARSRATDEIGLDEDFDAPKFPEYQLPGGKNYKELLLRFPARASQTIQEYYTSGGYAKDYADIGIAWKDLNSAQRSAVGEAYAEAGRRDIRQDDYTAGHYAGDYPNTLTTVRFNERVDSDGKKVLFIEEIQDDWAQEGREKGYGPEETQAEFDARKAKAAKIAEGTVYDGKQNFDITDLTAEDQKRIKYLEGYSQDGNLEGVEINEWTRLVGKAAAATNEQLEAIIIAKTNWNETRYLGVPDRPLKQSRDWGLLAMKRMIRHAAENGYDSIGWTTGEQQADRYDLSKQIDRIEYKLNSDGTADFNAISNDSFDSVMERSGASKEEVRDAIGKEIADKIFSDDGISDESFGEGVKALVDEDLKVGGEGMAGFYDKILPNAVNKFVKKFGGRASITTIETEPMPGDAENEMPINDDGLVQREVHSLNITPAMHESARGGMPLFSRKQQPAQPDLLSKPTAKENIENRLKLIEDRLSGKDKTPTAPEEGKGDLFKQDSTIAGQQALFSKAPRTSANPRFSDTETEARYQEARKGLADQRTMITRFNDFTTYTWHGFTRRHIDLPNEAQFALANEALRQYEAAPQAAKEEAIRDLKNITKGISRAEYDLFTRKVILDDLAYEVELGHDLPFGFAPETLAQDKTAVDAAIAANDKLQRSLEYRKTLQDKIKSGLVDAGILSEEQTKNPAYFRHQVLTYARARQLAQGTGGNLRKPKPGYAKKRKGSLEDINANYLEAEFEFLHRAMIDLKAVETIKKISRDYDISADLKKQAKTKSKDIGGKVDWRDLLPEGVSLWQPDKGNLFYTGLSVPERMINQLMDKLVTGVEGMSMDAVEEVITSIRKAVMLGGKKFEMAIPTEIANTLDKMRPDVDQGLFDHLLATPLKWWKQWVLINPRRVLKYNINNISGDLDAVIAGNPKSVKRLPEAIKELYAVMQGSEPSARYKEAVDRGVFDGGLTVQEIPDIQLLDPFQHIIEKPTLRQPVKFTGNSLYSVWKVLRDYTRFRENWLRYAAYLDYADRMEAGESMQSIGYGATNPAMADEVIANNTKDGAALLARDLVGDYGNVSSFGRGIRKKVIPFYSWMEVNTKRYVRLISNAYGQGIGKGLATTGIIGASLGAKTTVHLGVRMIVLYSLVNLWNNLFFGDDEEELSTTDRVRMHLNLGKDDNGKVRTLRFQGALSDFLQWFGAEDAVATFLEIEKGRADWSDVAKAVTKGAPNKIASGLTPVIKLPFELASGLSFYPDAFNPRPIKDKVRQTTRMFSLENEYDWLTGRPTRGYLKSLGSAIIYKRDVGEMAYYKTLGLVRQYKKKTRGTEGYSTYTSPRSRALYDWRLAVRLGDERAEKRALAEMEKIGLTFEDREKAIARAHPLSGVAKRDRSAFIRTLSPREKISLDKAVNWYGEVYIGDPDATQYFVRRDTITALEEERKTLKKASKNSPDENKVYDQFIRDNRRILGTGKHEKIRNRCRYRGGGVLAKLKAADCKINQERSKRKDLREMTQTTVTEGRIKVADDRILKIQRDFNNYWTKLMGE